jgi:hypothetical protein
MNLFRLIGIFAPAPSQGRHPGHGSRHVMSTVLAPLSPRQTMTVLAAVALSLSFGGREAPPGKRTKGKTSARPPLVVSVYPSADAPAAFNTCCDAAWRVWPSGLRRFEAVHETTCNNSSDYIYSGTYSGTHTGAYPYYAGAAFDFDLSAVPIGAKIDHVTVAVCASRVVPDLEGNFKGNISYWQPDRDGVAYFKNADDGVTIVVRRASRPSNPFEQYGVAAAPIEGFAPSVKGRTSTSKIRLYLFGDNVAISQIYLRLILR